MRTLLLSIVLLAAGCGVRWGGPAALPPDMEAKPPFTPEARALGYLAEHVPRWPIENKCRSCHHSGDGARVLYIGRKLGYPISDQALSSSTLWLNDPDRWEMNSKDADYRDPGLERIQFTSALIEAMNTGMIRTRDSLERAASLVARDQNPEGSWQAQFPADIGSPVTYGRTLATVQARSILLAADRNAYQVQIDRATRWLLTAEIQRVIDAAAVLRGLEGADGDEAAAKRQQCRETIRKGRSADGGWGPFINSRPEVFDTAMVILALAGEKDDESTGWVRHARAWLIDQQKEDGSWPETTRPGGGDSYAQRTSTTAWAALALLRTSAKQ